MKKGQTVKVKSLGVKGEIVELLPEIGQVVLQINGHKIPVPIKDIERARKKSVSEFNINKSFNQLAKELKINKGTIQLVEQEVASCIGQELALAKVSKRDAKILNEYFKGADVDKLSRKHNVTRGYIVKLIIKAGGGYTVAGVGFYPKDLGDIVQGAVNAGKTPNEIFKKFIKDDELWDSFGYEDRLTKEQKKEMLEAAIGDAFLIFKKRVVTTKEIFGDMYPASKKKRHKGRRHIGVSQRMTDEAQELLFWIENSGWLYHRMHLPIIKNLMRKRKKGIFIKEKAVKAFLNLADEGARHYNQEISRGGWRIPDYFPKKVRLEVAHRLLKHFITEADLGNYDHLLKSKKRTSVSGLRKVRKVKSSKFVRSIS